jgi:signal transduction histidine kinase
MTYEDWWIQESKSTFYFFKIIASLIYSMMISVASVGTLVLNNIEGVPKAFMLGFFISMTLLVGLIWYLDTNFSRLSLVVGYFTIEVLNISFYLGATKGLKDHQLIFCIGSSIITILFQLGFVSNFKLTLLVTLKHIFLWYTSKIIFKEIPFHFPLSISGPMCVIIYVTVSEYLKRKKSFETFITSKELELAQRNLKTILDCFPDGLIVFNQSLEIQYANYKILEYLQCTAEDLFNILRAQVYISNRRSYEGPNHSNSLMNDIQNCFLMHVGKESPLGLTQALGFIYEWKIKKILWKESEGILVSCSDITNLIQLEHSSAENKAKTSLIRSFSHEMRTPISAILHFTDLSLKSYNITPDVRSYLNYVLASSKQLLSQVNDFIDLSSILARNFKLLNQRFSLKSWLNENFKIFEVLTQQKNIKFEVDMDPKIPEVIYTDPGRLKQVVYNFVSNSLKFTHKGNVKLVLRLKPNHRIKFKIIDSGVGIPEDRLGSIKDFFSNTSKIFSCGIGLYISKLLLDQLGNECLKVNSALGMGSTFSFVIKVSEPILNSCSTYTTDKSTEEGISDKKLKIFDTESFNKSDCEILIVDDIELNRKILVSVLKDNKVKILEAGNGREAVNFVREMNRVKKSIKVVIMDCSMPVMNGWEATKAIRELELQGEIVKSPAIIGHTAYSSDEDIRLCYESGMDTYLIKPSPPEAILKTVNYYLNL